MKFKAILVLTLMFFVALFSVQNATMITVRFLHWEFALSQALVILLSAFCGMLAGLVIGTVSGLGRSRRAANPPPPPPVS